MNGDTWFDAIGLAFARTAQEVETAQESFFATRETLMKELSGLLLECAGNSGIKIQEQGIKQQGLDTWHAFDAHGEYLAARKQKSATMLGFGFGQGDFWNDGGDFPFGFYTYIYIRMSKPETERIQLKEKRVFST